MKKIEIECLNDIIYLKDKDNLANIITKLRNKLGFEDVVILSFILDASSMCTYKLQDRKIDFIVKYLEEVYNNLFGTSLGLHIAKNY